MSAQQNSQYAAVSTVVRPVVICVIGHRCIGGSSMLTRERQHDAHGALAKQQLDSEAVVEIVCMSQHLDDGLLVACGEAGVR